MAEVKVIAEVAGRVCALPLAIGDSVVSGDDIVFVEAMKMEIPVQATAAGKLASLSVKLDDMVAEGQVIATITT